MQIGPVESPLVLFFFVLSLYDESLGGCGFTTILSTIVLQALLDRAHGELPSDNNHIDTALEDIPWKHW